MDPTGEDRDPVDILQENEIAAARLAWPGGGYAAQTPCGTEKSKGADS